jgi:hypothetical protein
VRLCWHISVYAFITVMFVHCHSATVWTDIDSEFEILEVVVIYQVCHIKITACNTAFIHKHLRMVFKDLLLSVMKHIAQQDAKLKINLLYVAISHVNQLFLLCEW